MVVAKEEATLTHKVGIRCMSQMYTLSPMAPDDQSTTRHRLETYRLRQTLRVPTITLADAVQMQSRGLCARGRVDTVQQRRLPRNAELSQRANKSTSGLYKVTRLKGAASRG